MSDFKVALCCIGRMENQYAQEFVDHYKRLGFDKIFIYDNNYDGEEHFETVIGDYVRSGLVEIINYRNKQVCQTEAYADCYRKHSKEYEWIAFFDMDEFLYIDTPDIHEFMKRFDGYQCLLINWMIMTDNGQIYNTHRPLSERFTKPMPYDQKCGYDFPENNHIKSIVRGGLDEIKFSNPHIPSTPLSCCNAQGKKCDQTPWQPYDHSVAFLKHYQYKTLQEWITKKMKRGMPDQSYESFLKNTPIENFYRVNERTDDKDEYIDTNRQQKVIVSMTTIPKRMKRLLDNLPALLNQSYKYDKLIINIDDDLEEAEREFYYGLVDKDPRIVINEADGKWRSCNKLLPTLQLYPHDIIITLDDDVYYPKDTILELVKEHLKHPQCVIAHEVNPLRITKNDDDTLFINYINGYDVKLRQVEWGKYLSNCALFPPYTFQDTDLYDYEKMMHCTNGTHDELWFWVQSTLNNVQCVGLNYVRSFAPEMLEQYKEDEYCLSAFNNKDDKIKAYMDKINAMYGDRLMAAIDRKQTIFTVTNDNVYAFIFLYPYIKNMYNYGARVDLDNTTKAWTNKVLGVIQRNEQPRI